MNGVEILSSKTIYDTILPGWVTGISLIIFVLFFVLCVTFATKFEKVCTIICLILTVASIAPLVLSLVPNETDVNHIEYQVTIDDSVSMNAFLDKYEILYQEGRIYTVKERSDE